jgi:hypothetical protein
MTIALILAEHYAARFFYIVSLFIVAYLVAVLINAAIDRFFK